MAFTFNPTIYSSSTTTTYNLPQPITVLSPNFGWRAKSHETPKKSGQSTYGLVSGPITVQLSGEISKQSAAATVTESDMWDEIVTMQTLGIEAETSLLEFFFYFDTSGGGTYVKLKDVWISSLSPNIGDESRLTFGYSIQLTANDPVIYTTGVGL